MTEKPDSDHNSKQPYDGHSNRKSSHLRWVFIGGGIAIAGLLVAAIWWPNLTERTKFFTENLLNLVIALAVIAQGLIYRKQWDVMDRQLKTLTIGEQAYMVLSEIKFTSLEPDIKPAVSATVLNGGRTPAVNVNFAVNMFLAPSRFFAPPIERREFIATKGIFIPAGTEKTLEMSFDITISKEQMTTIQAASLWIIIDGEIQYTDFRQLPHAFPFRAVYSASKGDFTEWKEQ
jgi:hypothetical protein